MKKHGILAILAAASLALGTVSTYAQNAPKNAQARVQRTTPPDSEPAGPRNEHGKWGTAAEVFKMRPPAPGFVFDGVSDVAKGKSCTDSGRELVPDPNMCHTLSNGQKECKNRCVDAAAAQTK